MGYACPVCGDPQADGSHLANHLAFTAMLGDDRHEECLHDHAPGWGDMGEAALAEVVVEHAAETAFPKVFEDTAGGLDDDAATGGEHREATGAGGRSSGDEGTTPDAAASPEGDAERDNNE